MENKISLVGSGMAGVIAATSAHFESLLEKKPKFKVPTWPINPLDPWKGTDADGEEFAQLYVTRKMKDIECVAEIDLSDEQNPEVGNCFDLSGREIILTLEERDKALTDWMDWADRKAREGII